MVQENIDIQITTSDIQGVMQDDPNVALRIQNKALNRVSLGLQEEVAKLKARIAKFGPVIQIGEKEDSDEGFPKYCNIPYDKLIKHISIDEAISIINKKDEDNKLVSVEHDGDLI